MDVTEVARMEALEQRVAKLEQILNPTPVARDDAHEARDVTHFYECGRCGAGQQRAAKGAHSHPKEIPCGACGGIAKHTTTEDVRDDATGVVDDFSEK